MFPYMGDDRICDKHEYGRHISLTCKNHRDLRWNTKNIGGIGQRTIFYSSTLDIPYVPECECSGRDLENVCQ